MRIPSALILALISISFMPAKAEDIALTRLLAARSLKCHFGQVITEPGKSTSPDFEMEVQFYSIDLNKQSARVISTAGVGDVRVLNTEVGLSFLETEPALDITTVFAAYTVNSEFVAVDSRHVIVFGAAKAEQYFGTCKVWR